MIDRINLIMQAKNLTSRQFAEEIGIQPSGMSHIMNGRNRPSLDFVMKVVNRYPEIDINWLMFGKGEMIAPNGYVPTPVTKSVSMQGSLFSDNNDLAEENNADLFHEPAMHVQTPTFGQLQSQNQLQNQSISQQQVQPQSQPQVQVQTQSQLQEQTPSQLTPHVDPVQLPQPQLDENRVNEKESTVIEKNDTLEGKRIVKVIVLYSDHSFSEYYPE